MYGFMSHLPSVAVSARSAPDHNHRHSVTPGTLSSAERPATATDGHPILELNPLSVPPTSQVVVGVAVRLLTVTRCAHRRPPQLRRARFQRRHPAHRSSCSSTGRARTDQFRPRAKQTRGGRVTSRPYGAAAHRPRPETPVPAVHAHDAPSQRREAVADKNRAACNRHGPTSIATRLPLYSASCRPTEMPATSRFVHNERISRCVNCFIVKRFRHITHDSRPCRCGCGTPLNQMSARHHTTS